MCTKIEKFCLAIEKLIATDNPETDDPTRFAVYMGHQPNGTPARTIMHYAQNMREDRFQEFSENYETWYGKYLETEKPLIPLNNIRDVPVAMFVGESDLLANPKDAEWTKEQIGEAVIYYQQMAGGHLSFLVGKDMTYFKTNVMNLIQEYHPVYAKTNI